MRIPTLLAFLVAFVLAPAARPADNPLAALLSSDNLKHIQASGAEVAPGPRPGSVTIRFPSSETPGSVTIPVPASARDWAPYGTFTFEFVSSSTIRWDLAIKNAKGQSGSVRVQPYANVPVRAAISSRFLTRDYMNNRAYKGHWLSNWSNHLDLGEVESISVRMSPNRAVTLTLGPMALEKGDVPDEVLITKPIVDEFGQWAAGDWPGKVRAASDLEAAWRREDEELKKPTDYGYCPYGGWKARQERATGFFHTAEVEGRWWLVDPDGHLFFSTGMDCVRLGDQSPLAGREKLFTKLPPGSDTTVNFYQANAKSRYGEPALLENWKAKSEERLRAWGFNTVANWSQPALYEKPRLPFVTNIQVARGARNWHGFPDVFSDAFQQAADEQAREQCTRFRDEPLLIGYFIGNEPRWPGRNLADTILNDAEASATQAFIKRFLAEKQDTAASREQLLEALARQYHKVIADAIRKADPNHLVLGIRYAGNVSDAMLRANDVFDVFSINIYRWEPDPAQIQHIYETLKKPVMIGEFHFGAVERGYAPSLVMVKDQAERGIAFQYYVEHAAALASVIGVHYFQFGDQPVTGRFDGENYNLGFVSQQDVPYAEMVQFARSVHRRINEVHAGMLQPASRKALVR